MNIDFSVLATPQAWVSLITLLFLEVVLGIDNLVFIAITSARLPKDKQHIGRRLGLMGAMVMRCILLCIAAWLVTLTQPLFEIEQIQIHGEPFSLSVRDLILLAGGIYLIYKGISELKDKIGLVDEKARMGHPDACPRCIGLAQAVATIMVMDIVFSLDSVFTAVGLSGQIVVMVPAVIIAVIIMMVFADPISNFIEKHAEMKILALTFIVCIGVLLVIEAFGLESGMQIMGIGVENLAVYFAMVFSIVLELLQMRYNKNLAQMHAEIAEQHENGASET